MLFAIATTTTLAALFRAVHAAPPTGSVSVSTSASANQCVGGSIQYTVNFDGIPAADPARPTALTQVSVSVGSASVVSNTLASFTQGVNTLTIPSAALKDGNGVTDAVVTVSVFYAGSADVLSASSSESFAVWDCSNANVKVPGTVSVTYPVIPRICAQQNNIPYTISVTGVPESDPKYGPTIIRATIGSVLGDTGAVFSPRLLSSTSSPITGNYTVPVTLSGQAGFTIKVQLNYFGQNSSSSATFTTINSVPFTVADADTCFNALNSPTAAPVSSKATATAAATSAVVTSSKSSANGVAVLSVLGLGLLALAL
ncbi:hypothetical protein CcCBS67573_g10541 [Chytriomyces confervae]|uniref:Uncharacterized protein n=1 Tax=Chytriomyces confervae TaxID=246404 RepID=A0A507CS51_9FUNG|nr:hypothetical protein CcCBS67573_g10541 [Chytriomyces confervae]